MLERKAKHNYNVAEFAEEIKHFDTAVSRYYYYLYQSITHYMDRIPIVLAGNYNHDTRIWSLISHLQQRNRDEYEQNREVLKLQGLKTQRHHSDYHSDKILDSNHKFEVRFKNDFLEVENALKKLAVLR